MKFYYPPLIVTGVESEEIYNYYHVIGLLAITDKKELVLVRDIHYEDSWKDYWKQYKEGKRDAQIEVFKENKNEPDSITVIASSIVSALHYIINKKYIFTGILYMDGSVYDQAILDEGGIFKWFKKQFSEMPKKFRQMKKYPIIGEDFSIQSQFIGLGEKFFLLNERNPQQIAQMSEFFQGNLCGIMGVPSKEAILEFVILSQNITKEKTLASLKLDKKGRDTLRNLVKTKKFFPAGGFKLDYGIRSFQNLPHWNSLELLPNVTKAIRHYKKYITALALGKKNPFLSNDSATIFDEKFELKLKATEQKKRKLSAKELLSMKTKKDSTGTPKKSKSEQIKEKTASTPKKEVIPLKKEVIPLKKASIPLKKATIPLKKEVIPLKKEVIPLKKATIPLKKASIPLKKATIPLKKATIPLKKATIPLKKASIPLKKASIPLKKASIPLQKASLPLQKVQTTKSEPQTSELDQDESEEVYSDVFNQPKEQLFSADGNTVIDPSNMSEDMLINAAQSLDLDFGMAINTSIMSEADVFSDLEASLAALSKLDELAEKDEAISRIYYPPPTLISYANKEGMQIGGSTCIISMGVGRNLTMVPELKRMQMWGKFYKDMEGNPQIEDFVAMEEKDIESVDELENMIQKAFINIRQTGSIFIGVIEIEGNGFERNVFDECELEWEDIEKLMNIHIERRQTIQFPELSVDSFIDMRTYGNQENIKFLTNPSAQGLLEIAEETRNNPLFITAILGGIICVDEEAAYFFILSDNFSQNNPEGEQFIIDNNALNKMYSLIENAGLTPVSWFKISAGFKGFETIFLWDEIKEGPFMGMVKDKYDFFISKLLKTKATEDKIRDHAIAEFPNKKEEPKEE
jgi:hypothetical protein